MKHLILLILALLLNICIYAQTLKPAEQEQLLDYYQSQRYTEAVKLLQEIYGQNPQDEKAISMLAYANNMAGSLKEAEQFYLKLYQLDTKRLAVLFSLAGINARRGNQEKTVHYYKEILKIDSNNFRALKLLGSTLNSGVNTEKLKYLKKANQIIPTDGDVAYDLAIELNLLKQTDEAYKVLEQAYQADTSNYLLLKAKLPIVITLKKFEEAARTGDDLLSSGDSSSLVLNSMGKLALQNKSYQQAIRFFKALEQRSQESESSLYYTAICYQKLNDLKNAKSYINATIDFSLSPNISSYYSLLGYLEESSHAYKAANLAYQNGLRFKNNGAIYYNLALLYDYKLKKQAAALKYYRRYLQSNPDEKQQENIQYARDRIKSLTNKKLFNP
jgi:tetratricopeptide (TPR) repeat protein